MDAFGLFSHAINGAINRRTPSTGLWGPDLVRYWSSMDQNTPDKLTHDRARDLALRFPGSQFGKWMQPFMSGGARGGGLYQMALGRPTNSARRTSWWNPNPWHNSFFRGLGRGFGGLF